MEFHGPRFESTAVLVTSFVILDQLTHLSEAYFLTSPAGTISVHPSQSFYKIKCDYMLRAFSTEPGT